MRICTLSRKLASFRKMRFRSNVFLRKWSRTVEFNAVSMKMKSLIKTFLNNDSITTGGRSKSKLELNSNLSEILPANSRFIQDSNPTSSDKTRTCVLEVRLFVQKRQKTQTNFFAYLKFDFFQV